MVSTFFLKFSPFPISIKNYKINITSIKKLPKKVLFENLTTELDKIEEWISAEDFGPAETYLIRLEESYAGNARVNFLLGKLYSKISNAEFAEKYLTRSIFYAPENIGYHFFYADFFCIK